MCGVFMGERESVEERGEKVKRESQQKTLLGV
jgi:hypothetical protein